MHSDPESTNFVAKWSIEIVVAVIAILLKLLSKLGRDALSDFRELRDEVREELKGMREWNEHEFQKLNNRIDQHLERDKDRR